MIALTAGKTTACVFPTMKKNTCKKNLERIKKKKADKKRANY